MVVLISFLFILMVICLPVIGGIVSFGGAFLLNKRAARVCLVVSVFTLGILSILFVPFVRNDLYRYFQKMQSVQYLQNLHQFFEYEKQIQFCNIKIIHYLTYLNLKLQKLIIFIFCHTLIRLCAIHVFYIQSLI